jgi:hypothetical protein
MQRILLGMSEDEGTWYELWPNSHKPTGTKPERYREKAEARDAARRMRARETDLQFVDIVEVQILDGESSMPRPIDSI